MLERLEKAIFAGRKPQWLLLPALIPALILLIRFLPVFASRLRFEIDIEWTEGGGLLHALRLMHGEALYPPPHPGFMPYPYPPLHPFLLAVLGKVFGLSFGLGRGFSLAAVLGTWLLLSREVSRSFGSRLPWLWGGLLLGLILVGYPVTGTYYDLIRIDALALLLNVASCVAVLAYDEQRSTRRLFVCLALFLAATLTKQLSVFYVAWLLLFLALRHFRKAVILGVAFSLSVAAIVVLTNWATHGGFLHFIYFNIGKHEIRREFLRNGAKQLFVFAPYMAALLPLAGFLAWQRRLSRRALAWLGMFLVTIPAGLLPYAKVGGWVNNFMPIVVLVGACALCLLGNALVDERDGKFRRLGQGGLLLVAYAACGYTLAHSFDPRRFGVDKQRRQSAKALVNFARELGPRALSPGFPYLSIQGGSSLEQSAPMPWFDASWAGLSKFTYADYYERVDPEFVLLSGFEPNMVLDPIADKLVLDRVCSECSVNAVLYENVPLPNLAFKRKRARKNANCLFEFERKELKGWELSGDAFEEAHLRSGAEIVGAEGRGLLSSQHNDKWDKAHGVALSPSFEVSAPRLSLRVGGGDMHEARVELLVDGRAVESASGLNADALKEFIWDVSAWRGKSARIRVVDETSDSWGHILLDSVCLEN